MFPSPYKTHLWVGLYQLRLKLLTSSRCCKISVDWFGQTWHRMSGHVQNKLLHNNNWLYSQDKETKIFWYMSRCSIVHDPLNKKKSLVLFTITLCTVQCEPDWTVYFKTCTALKASQFVLLAECVCVWGRFFPESLCIAHEKAVELLIWHVTRMYLCKLYVNDVKRFFVLKFFKCCSQGQVKVTWCIQGILKTIQKDLKIVNHWK